MESTLQEMDEVNGGMQNLCGCLHGGLCIDPVDRICACKTGFEGLRCEETFLGFTHKEKESENNLVLIIVITGLALCVTCFIGIYAYRRYKSAKKKRKSAIKVLCRTPEMLNLSGKMVDERVVLIPDETGDSKATLGDTEDRQCRRYIVICLDDQLPGIQTQIRCDRRSDNGVLCLENGTGIERGDEMPERKRRRGISF